MAITRSRTETVKNPLVPSIQKWLANRYITELANATTEKQIKKVKKRFTNVPDEAIWVETLKTPVTLSSGNTEYFLCCFSVLPKGYLLLDAKISYSTLQNVIDHYAIPVTTVATYTELITAVKAGNISTLYRVTAGSGQLGICVDNRLSNDDRYKQIIEVLGGVSFNIAVNYTGQSFSTSNPHVGEVSLMWPGFTTASLEAYPVEEIIAL